MSLLRIPMIDRQGIWGRSARVSWLTLAAASPIISSARVNAKANISSESRSSRLRPAANACAFRAASSISSRRVRSCLFIDDLCSPNHVVAEMPAQRTRCIEIDFSPKQFAEFVLDLSKLQVAHLHTRCKLNKHVDVAFWSEGGRKYGAKQGETADTVSFTKIGQINLRPVNRHAAPSFAISSRQPSIPHSDLLQLRLDPIVVGRAEPHGDRAGPPRPDALACDLDNRHDPARRTGEHRFRH